MNLDDGNPGLTAMLAGVPIKVTELVGLITVARPRSAARAKRRAARGHPQHHRETGRTVVMGNVLYVHPLVWPEVKRRLQERQRGFMWGGQPAEAVPHDFGRRVIMKVARPERRR